jgi:allantoinase
VRGGTVVRPDHRLVDLDLVIDGGRIVEVAPGGAVDHTGAATIDAGGLLVFPGGIDPHVHFDEPGRTEWEGFDCGSAAAAAGGVTTVVDMPIDSDPPTTTAAAARHKAAAARRSSRVDVALWGGLVPASVGELPALAEEGVVGFKAFACPSGWDDFPPSDAATIRAGLEMSAATGLPVALHAELEALGHTEASEVEAIRMAGALAAETGGRLHIVHVSSAAGVDEAHRWPGVTVETCPHYLLLTDRDADHIGANARCAPPIRSQGNQDELWQRLRSGLIDCVASDHSPCPPAFKQGPSPFAGISGVETTLPLLLSSRRLAPAAIARLTCAAATLLGLAGKGRLEPGYDADLAIVDPDAEWTITSDTLFNRHHRSPFAGQQLRGRVVRTLVRGRTVFTLGAGPVDPGGAAVLRPGLQVSAT